MLCHAYQTESGSTDVQHIFSEAISHTSPLKLHVPHAHAKFTYIHRVTDSEMMKLKNFMLNYFSQIIAKECHLRTFWDNAYRHRSRIWTLYMVNISSSHDQSFNRLWYY